MRIKNIELHNFGSYAGHNSFNFESMAPEERVVVIGGKNGAGKTTLFTAVQVCLYGNYAFGFKTTGKKYLTEIYDLINSQVRIDEKESAYLEIGFQQVDNTDLYDYVIRRSWSWQQNEMQEFLSVWQNGQRLQEDELLNFQNYLIHLIPPDMLKLYFFDGEKIADYFFGSKEVNIRDALMVLSGNDTFDILYEQVKRVLKSSEKSGGSVAQEYMDAQNMFDLRLVSTYGWAEEQLAAISTPLKYDITFETETYRSGRKHIKKTRYKEHPFGKIVGRHDGAQFYTIGQRKGLNVGGHKDSLFVIETDIPSNIIYVGEGHTHKGLSRSCLRVAPEEIHWIRPDLAMSDGEIRRYRVRIRYRQPLQDATLIKRASGLYILFDAPQRGITPGQFAVWYDGDEMIGSGVI